MASLIGIYPKKEEAIKWSRELFQTMRKQDEVSKKFAKQLKQILIENINDNAGILVQRTIAAKEYFNIELQKIIDSVNAHKNEYIS